MRPAGSHAPLPGVETTVPAPVQRASAPPLLPEPGNMRDGALALSRSLHSPAADPAHIDVSSQSDDNAPYPPVPQQLQGSYLPERAAERRRRWAVGNRQ